MKLTEAQLQALLSARDRGSASAHITGRSASGGFTRTLVSLKHHGLLDRHGKITDAGRAELVGLSGFGEPMG